METRVNTSSGYICLRNGMEGPRQDPYSFTETTFKRGDLKVRLREGIGLRLEVTTPQGYAQLDQCLSLSEDSIYFLFKVYTGYTPRQLAKLVERVSQKCRKCGSWKITCERGHPGEYLAVCANCKNILSGHFNVAEVE
jgi:hypothetical protein